MENTPSLSRLYMIFNNVTLEDIRQRYGDNKAFLNLFSHIDKLDGNADSSINSSAVFNVDASFLRKLETYVEGKTEALTDEQRRIQEYQEAQGYLIMDEGRFELDDKKIAAYIKAHPDLAGVRTSDVKQFFEALIKIDDEKSEQSGKEYEQRQLAKNPNLPKNVALQIGLDESVKVIKKDGKTYYDVDGTDGSKRRYDAAGHLLAYESDVSAIGDGEGHWNTLGSYRETMLYDDEGEELGEVRRYNNSNVVDREFYDSSNTLIRQMGRAEFTYKNDKLEDITVNKGLPNSISLKCKYDENGNLKDFKISTKEPKTPNLIESNLKEINNPIKFTDSEKQMLMKLLNSGAKLGEDFSLDMVNNKLKINPIIKNESGEKLPALPEAVRADMLNYASGGLRNNRDYTIKYANGQYVMDFDTAKGRNYLSEDTKVIYSKDGKTKITKVVNGNDITTTLQSGNNQTVQKENREDAFLEKLLMGDFKGANDLIGDVGIVGSDFNFYSLCKKYEQLTGKNLMDEMLNAYDKKLISKDMISKLVPHMGGVIFGEGISPEKKEELYKETLKAAFEDDKLKYDQISKFDVSKSDVGNMIYQNNKQVISDNKYIETSNGKTYTVQRGKDTISIEKDGKSYTINLKGINENLQKILFSADANVLYRIAEKGIKFGVFSDVGSTNPQNVNGYYDPQKNTIMLNSDVLAGSKLTRTLAHEVGHTFYDVQTPENKELEAVFKEELEAFNKSDDQFKEGDHSYCTTHIFEMVAESYSLLTTGHSKSEYTIAKYFPKTFALIKKLIEGAQ